MTYLVLQVPPLVGVTVIFFRVLVIFNSVLIDGQSLHEPQAVVSFPGFGRPCISFLMICCLMVFGLRKATRGFSLNTLLNDLSCCIRWKCSFNTDATLLSDGCQSHTNNVCGSFPCFTTSSRRWARSIPRTSFRTFSTFDALNPRFTKNWESCRLLFK